MKVPLDTDYLKDIEVEEESLTDWSNPPRVSDLKQNYDDAIPAHSSQISKVNLWLDNLHVTGSAVVDKKPNKSSIVPKLIRKQAEWRYSALSEPFLSTNDLFNVDPITYEDKEASIQNALVLNNQFNTKINKIKFIDEYVRAAVDEGTVIARVGWEYEEAIEEVEVPDYAPVPMNPMGLGMPLGGSESLPMGMNQGMPSQVPTQPQMIQIGSHMEERVKVIKNRPTVEVCNLENVIIDPTCNGDIDKAQFVIYTFETNLSELKKDGRYKNLDNINIETNSVLAEPDHKNNDDSSFSFRDKPRKKFIAYEYWGYWDIYNDGIVKPIVATFVGDTMIRLEESPFPDGKPPFVVAQYLPIRKSIYGEPDGALLEDNQKIIGAVTRGMIDIMGRSANGQVIMRKDAFDVVNRRKFEKGLDCDINPNIEPERAATVLKYPEIPNSAEYMLNMQNMDAESMTGVKAFHSGISGSAFGDTATGVRTALDAASKRELGILRRLAAGIVDIGRKIIAMNSIFLSEEEVIRITNEEFITIKKDDLYGNFDLRLTISTAEADNQKAQELAFMLQTMGNSMPMDMSQMILSDIARLRNMPDLAKKIATYQPQPDPMQQKMAELQVAMLEAQVMNERAKGQENQVDVELKSAKTQTELAKTRNLESQSDLRDLDFLHKESGEDLNRKLQEKDFDRRSQLDLTAAKKLSEGDKVNNMS